MQSTPAWLSRRSLLSAGFGLTLTACSAASGNAEPATGRSGKKEDETMSKPDPGTIPDYDRWQLSEAEWKQRLSSQAYGVLRKEGTERPYSSALNDEKRAGLFACSGCGFDLFSSTAKYESHTGWPSFYDALPNAIGTKTDFKIVVPRTEYHCARCGGHQGHVFKDGPAPTGLRYCNNGLALTFKPA